MKELYSTLSPDDIPTKKLSSKRTKILEFYLEKCTDEKILIAFFSVILSYASDNDELPKLPKLPYKIRGMKRKTYIKLENIPDRCMWLLWRFYEVVRS